MESLDDAVALLKSRGLRAIRRQWSLGDTVLVTHARRDVSDGIEVFPEALYIVCSNENWEVLNPMIIGPGEKVECISLAEACDVVTDYLLPAPVGGSV
jgi:hypothetical protein